MDIKQTRCWLFVRKQQFSFPVSVPVFSFVIDAWVHFVCLCSLITFVLFTPIVILAFNPILCKMNSKSYKTCDLFYRHTIVDYPCNFHWSAFNVYVFYVVNFAIFSIECWNCFDGVLFMFFTWPYCLDYDGIHLKPVTRIITTFPLASKVGYE